MSALIFGGDMLVMAFMIVLVAWLALGSSDGELDKAARLPLDDDARPPLDAPARLPTDDRARLPVARDARDERGGGNG